MKQLVRVRKLNGDGTVQAVCVRESACSGDCHQCGGCGAASQTVELTAQNPIGAKPGELVTVTSPSGPVLLAALVLYIMPVALFFLGYLLGQVLWNRGGAAGCCGFALGITGAAAYDRLVERKRKTVYTITGYGEFPAEY